MAEAIRDQNHVTNLLLESSSTPGLTLNAKGDEVTGRLLVDNAGGGSGTVTSVSVVSANGFAGSVATATTTPAITLSTTINSPVLAGNGTAISAATTTGSGSTVVLATAPVFPTTITVGAAAGATGDILMKGTTSGTVTITTADAAGTWTFQLPTNDGDAGQVLTTNGSGVTTWETPAGGGNVSNTGTPLDNQIAVWTSATVIEGTAGLTYDGANLQLTGDIGSTGSRITKGWFTDLQVTNAIAGSITGNAATLTVADETTDTSCFIGFYTASSGSLPGKTNTNMTFNSNTGVATFASTVLTTTDINGGTIDGVTIGGASAGAITGTTITANTGFMPDANDGAYLGQSGTAFSDLFLASGAVIDFAAGNAVVTHSSGILTVSTGDLRVTTAGTNSASVVTVAGTQTLTNKIISQTFEPGSDDTYTGEVLTGLNAGATIAQWDCVYLGSASKWLLTDADAASSAGSVMVAMAVSSGTDTNPLTVILRGIVRNDGWTWATVGAPLYLDTTTAGGMTLTAPSGTDDVVKIVGYVLSDDCIYFNPSNDWITRV